MFKSLFVLGQILFTLSKYRQFFPLTKKISRDKMSPHAGMVELVDSVDLGSTARACRFESCCPHQITKAPLLGCFCYLQGKRDSNPSKCRCPVGSEGNAAGGGRSDPSEWQRSAAEEGASSPTKIPGTAAGGFIYFSFPLRERKMQVESCCPSLPAVTFTSHLTAYTKSDNFRQEIVAFYCQWITLFSFRALVRPSGLISPTASRDRLVREGPTNS